MRILRSLTCLIVFLMIGAAEADACSCVFGGGAVCQDYWKVSAVFVGTVIETKTVTLKRDNYERQQRLVRFSLDEAFRGVEGSQVEVMTGMGDSDCGIGFVQTGQYLVYATLFEDKLYTGICTRTKKVSSAISDLEYIRGLRTGKSGAAVYGEVTRYLRDQQGERSTRPVAGARITIEGSDKAQARTDAKGAYRVDGLPAGDYIVNISLPQTLTTRETERKITLTNGGCAVVSFWLENDGQLNGRVVNPAGLPVKNAGLFLIEHNKERYRGHWDAQYSDVEGKYAFKQIPAGRYVLLIRFDGMTSQNRPFPEMYYPGVSDRTQAKVITIGEGQTIANFDLEMPPLPLQREVTGSIVWSTRKPALGARVEYMADSINYRAKTDGADFSFEAYDGLRISIRATLELEKGKYVYSDSVQITVMPGLSPVQLVLPQP